MLSHKELFESDTNVTFRCLADHYLNADVPELNIAFFDIETDFSKEFGFALPEDPFNAITSIAVYLDWLDQTICLAIKPKGLSQDDAQEICDSFGGNVFLMDSEEDMLKAFIELIEDADVLSGWNSEGFDIPYIVNRIIKLLGSDYTRNICLWDQKPKKRNYESYGRTAVTYDLIGRVHLDYMQLYMKYTYHIMHSYSLDAIAEHELNEKKVEYDGTLDQLYNNDFQKFLEYNIQDVNLLKKLDDKLKYIDQANLLAHENTVLLPTTLGTVAQTDQAIMNEAHQRGMIVPDKSHKKDHIPAAGAYVAVPKKGMHLWIGSIDLNSLYPSIFRSCNMSLECIIGQIRHTETNQEMCELIRNSKQFAVTSSSLTKVDDIIEFGKTLQASPFAKYWEGKFACKEYELVMDKDNTVLLTLDFENQSSMQMTGAEIYDLIFNSGNPWCFTSNATILTFEKKGIVPSVLEKWYSERKELQSKARLWEQLMSDGIKLPERFNEKCHM